MSQKLAVLTLVFTEAGGNSGVNVTVSLSGKGPDGLSHDHEFTVSLIGPDEEWRVPKVGLCRLKPVFASTA